MLMHALELQKDPSLLAALAGPGLSFAAEPKIPIPRSIHYMNRRRSAWGASLLPNTRKI